MNRSLAFTTLAAAVKRSFLTCWVHYEEDRTRNKLKDKTAYSLVVFLILTGTLEAARAEVITHYFTGTITSVLGTLFGLSPSIGQQVQGSFTYDTSQPPAFDTGTVAGYIQLPPSGMSVVISDLTLQSQNYNSFQVINDDFGPVDNVNGFFTPISAGGVSQSNSSSISFGLSDFTLTALSSTALPPSLNVASFGQRGGSVFDAASGGSLNFSIDTPSLTPPPPPPRRTMTISLTRR